MSWERFQYLCRRIAQHDTLSPQEVMQDSSVLQNGHWYGPPVVPGQLPATILAEMLTVTDHAAVRRCAAVYGAMQSSAMTALSEKLRNMIFYLAVLFPLLLVCAAIYKVKVLPVFIDIYGVMGESAIGGTLAYMEYLDLITLVVIFVLGVSFALMIKLKQLVAAGGLADGSRMWRLLLSHDIRQAHDLLFQILRYPMVRMKGADAEPLSPVQAWLADAESSGMVITVELDRLATIQRQALQAASERQMSIMMVVIGVIVLAAIAGFVITAYLPIFYVGDTI